MREWRIAIGPRAKALSSETTGQYAGNERNRDRGAVTWKKPCAANGPRARVFSQSLKSPIIIVGRCSRLHRETTNGRANASPASDVHVRPDRGASAPRVKEEPSRRLDHGELQHHEAFVAHAEVISGATSEEASAIGRGYRSPRSEAVR